MDDVIAAIVEVRDNLRRGLYQNESQVSMVVRRLLTELGWAVDEPRQVRPNFKIGNGWVDYALLQEPFGAVILIEVKDVGKASASGEEQLFRYCSQQDVPLAVLTDGRTWRFYWPRGSGNYEQRRFAVADLGADEASDCAQMLGRYLEFNTVTSGRFESHAQSDYAAHRNRVVAETYFDPVAHSLITQADERLVVLFSEEVEKRCRIRPDDGDVRRYLRGQFARSVRLRSETGRTREVATQGGPVAVSRFELPSFVFRGEKRTFKTNDELITDLFIEFANGNPSFCEQLAPRLNGSAPILSRHREDFARRSRERASELPGGWWMNVVGDARAHDGRIRSACKVAGIEYDDLKVTLRSKRGGDWSP